MAGVNHGWPARLWSPPRVSQPTISVIDSVPSTEPEPEHVHRVPFGFGIREPEPEPKKKRKKKAKR